MDTLWIPFKYVLVHWLVVEPHLKKYESRNGFIFPKINNIGKHHFPVSIQHPSQPGPVKPGFPPGSLECLWSAQWIGRKTLVTGDGEAPKVTSYRGKEWSNWPTLQPDQAELSASPVSSSVDTLPKHVIITSIRHPKLKDWKPKMMRLPKLNMLNGFEWYPMVSPSSFGYILGQWLQLPGFNTAGITDMIDSHAWKDCR